MLEQTLEATAAIGFDDADLWFNATVEVFRGVEGVRTLTRRHPGARFSSPLDTLAPYLVYAGPAASRILGLMRSWGMTHLSIGACVEDARSVIGYARARGWPVNVWDVEDAEDLELALSMGPSSITADLGAIPAWVEVDRSHRRSHGPAGGDPDPAPSLTGRVPSKEMGSETPPSITRAHDAQRAEERAQG